MCLMAKLLLDTIILAIESVVFGILFHKHSVQNAGMLVLGLGLGLRTYGLGLGLGLVLVIKALALTLNQLNPATQ